MDGALQDGYDAHVQPVTARVMLMSLCTIQWCSPVCRGCMCLGARRQQGEEKTGTDDCSGGMLCQQGCCDDGCSRAATEAIGKTLVPANFAVPPAQRNSVS